MPAPNAMGSTRRYSDPTVAVANGVLMPTLRVRRWISFCVCLVVLGAGPRACKVHAIAERLKLAKMSPMRFPENVLPCGGSVDGEICLSREKSRALLISKHGLEDLNLLRDIWVYKPTVSLVPPLS